MADLAHRDRVAGRGLTQFQDSVRVPHFSDMTDGADWVHVFLRRGERSPVSLEGRGPHIHVKALEAARKCGLFCF